VAPGRRRGGACRVDIACPPARPGQSAGRGVHEAPCRRSPPLPGAPVGFLPCRFQLLQPVAEPAPALRSYQRAEGHAGRRHRRRKRVRRPGNARHVRPGMGCLAGQRAGGRGGRRLLPAAARGRGAGQGYMAPGRGVSQIPAGLHAYRPAQFRGAAGSRAVLQPFLLQCCDGLLRPGVPGPGRAHQHCGDVGRPDLLPAGLGARQPQPGSDRGGNPPHRAEAGPAVRHLFPARAAVRRSPVRPGVRRALAHRWLLRRDHGGICVHQVRRVAPVDHFHGGRQANHAGQVADRLFRHGRHHFGTGRALWAGNLAMAAGGARFPDVRGLPAAGAASGARRRRAPTEPARVPVRASAGRWASRR